MEHFFTTYVRTKTVFNHRLKDLKTYDHVKIYVYELVKLEVNHGPLLWHLKQKGEIWYDDKGNFKALRRGPIDPKLLERTRRRDKVKVKLNDLHVYMRDQLKKVTLVAPITQIPVYFKAFLDLRKTQIDAFFTVDAFSGRVHTPVVNLKSNLRKSLRLDGKRLVSLDVKQMQPTILAKVLLDHGVGENPFSTAIFKGEDVYVLLQNSAGLAGRGDAKKMLFKLIFGKPMDDIGSMFKGDTAWVDWINSYKSKTEQNNPHKENQHTNLAWLLQYSEVKVMTSIWERLRDADVDFLTIHDDVLCKEDDVDKVYAVMDEVLTKNFTKFSITISR